VQKLGGAGGQREGGPTSYRQGFLVRRLPSIVLFYLKNNGSGVTTQQTIRVQVKGLQANLIYLMGVCAVPNDAAHELEPEIDPLFAGLAGNYPPNPGTMQITPFVYPPQSTRMIFRPVFQDPTATDHKNHPLPQDIPYAWVVSGDDADGAYIDVDIPDSAWGAGEGVNVNGAIVFQISIAYDGSWWDSQALEKAISMVTATGTSAQPTTISTIGIG